MLPPGKGFSGIAPLAERHLEYFSVNKSFCIPNNKSIWFAYASWDIAGNSK